jgi:hypothetical protein
MFYLVDELTLLLGDFTLFFIAFPMLKLLFPTLGIEQVVGICSITKLQPSVLKLFTAVPFHSVYFGILLILAFLKVYFSFFKEHIVESYSYNLIISKF